MTPLANEIEGILSTHRNDLISHFQKFFYKDRGYTTVSELMGILHRYEDSTEPAGNLDWMDIPTDNSPRRYDEGFRAAMQNSGARAFVKDIVNFIRPHNGDLAFRFMRAIVSPNPPQPLIHNPPPIPTPASIPDPPITVSNLKSAPASKTINRPPKTHIGKYDAPPKTRILCQEPAVRNKNNPNPPHGRCASMFQNYSDLLRHCRKEHDLGESVTYDVSQNGPFTRDEIVVRRPGCTIKLFDGKYDLEMISE